MTAGIDSLHSLSLSLSLCKQRGGVVGSFRSSHVSQCRAILNGPTDCFVSKSDHFFLFFFALPSFVARFCFILFQLQATDLFLCLVFRWLSATFTCIYRLSYSRLINGFEDNNRTRKRERERENSCILLQNLTRKRRKETLNLLTKETKVYEWILSVTSHSLDYST